MSHLNARCSIVCSSSVTAYKNRKLILFWLQTAWESLIQQRQLWTRSTTLFQHSPRVLLAMKNGINKCKNTERIHSKNEASCIFTSHKQTAVYKKRASKTRPFYIPWSILFLNPQSSSFTRGLAQTGPFWSGWNKNDANPLPTALQTTSGHKTH